MNIVPGRLYAVLTGDIIQSSRLTAVERKRIWDSITSDSKKMTEIFRSLELMGPEVYRGDSWQILLSEPHLAMRTAFYIRAGLKACHQADTRISIGIGTIEHLPKNGLAQAHGEAFRFSGTGLDRLEKKENMVCWLIEPVRMNKFQTTNETALLNAYLNTALYFASQLADAWSQSEAWAVYKALEGKTQSEIALDWLSQTRTSQQNVAKTLSRAGWSGIERFLWIFESHIRQYNLDGS